MATRWTWRATSDDQSTLLNGNQWHGLNVFHSMTGKKANKTPQHTTQEYSIVEVNTCEAEKYLLLSILYNELFCDFNKILKIVLKTRDKIWAGTTVWQEEFEDREKFIDWFNKYLLSSQVGRPKGQAVNQGFPCKSVFKEQLPERPVSKRRKPGMERGETWASERSVSCTSLILTQSLAKVHPEWLCKLPGCSSPLRASKQLQ